MEFQRDCREFRNNIIDMHEFCMESSCTRNMQFDGCFVQNYQLQSYSENTWSHGNWLTFYFYDEEAKNKWIENEDLFDEEHFIR